MNNKKQIFFELNRTRLKFSLVLIAIAMVSFFGSTQRAEACCTCCLFTDHVSEHNDTISTITDATTDAFEALTNFVYKEQGPTLDPADSPQTFWHHMVLPQLKLFSLQMSTSILSFPAAIGGFLDADSQQEAQLRIQRLQAEATRDQLPAVSMCEFATLTKSLEASEKSRIETTRAISIPNLKRSTLNRELAGSENANEDIESRIEGFKSKYCFGLPNAADNSGLLADVCTATAASRKTNLDINFAQLLGAPKTIAASLYPTTPNNYGTDESVSQFEDIMALSRNLYGTNLKDKMPTQALEVKTESQPRHRLMRKRALAAKRNVAQHSFANYIGMKSTTDRADGSELSVRPHMEGLLRTLGYGSAADNELLDFFAQPGGISGSPNTSPSYWAQMEVLTKNLYQNPGFYANLYDNPANVRRQQAALKAIDLMQERDIHDTALRTETLLSLWLSTELDEYGKDIVEDWTNMKAGKQ